MIGKESLGRSSNTARHTDCRCRSKRIQLIESRRLTIKLKFSMGFRIGFRLRVRLSIRLGFRLGVRLRIAFRRV